MENVFILIIEWISENRLWLMPTILVLGVIISVRECIDRFSDLSDIINDQYKP